MVSNQNIKNMEQKMVEKIMGYSELFTTPDSNGRILTKVEINVVGNGYDIPSITFAPNAPTDKLFFRNHKPR